jgi:hypothetical protein
MTDEQRSQRGWIGDPNPSYLLWRGTRMARMLSRPAFRRRAVVAIAFASLLCALASCEEPKPARPTAPSDAPRECAGQPCCGDPPRPCGEVIQERNQKFEGSACKSACDCGGTGMDCNQGRCMFGTVAVFCCGACPAHVPPDQVCWNRDGTTSTCRPPASSDAAHRPAPPPTE